MKKRVYNLGRMSLEAITGLVVHFQTSKSIELEVIMRDTYLPHGVSFGVFQSLYLSLVASAEAGHMVAIGKSNIVDSFYPGNIRGRHEVGKSPVFITKTPIRKVDTVCDQRPGTMLRFNLKDELPKVKTYTPDIAPTYIRLQQHWNFLYRDRYMYTLKKVVQGPTKAEACLLPPSFEVELEMLHHAPTRFQPPVTTATSFLAKAIDLCGREGCSEPVLRVITS
jgi:hypothetical protein